MKVCIATPTIKEPHPAYLESLEKSVPVLEENGIEPLSVFEIGSPYISGARAGMLRKAMATEADIFVFIDHDISWEPEDLLKLIKTEGDVVCGTYRFKLPDEAYMGTIRTDPEYLPLVREDGCISATRVPAGFLKVTRPAIERFMAAYPDLIIEKDGEKSPDLFNHGAFKGTWYGEDYAFSMRWILAGGEIWLVPDLNLTHHEGEQQFPGNFHQFMLKQPGGSEWKST